MQRFQCQVCLHRTHTEQKHKKSLFIQLLFLQYVIIQQITQLISLAETKSLQKENKKSKAYTATLRKKQRNHKT